MAIILFNNSHLGMSCYRPTFLGLNLARNTLLNKLCLDLFMDAKFIEGLKGILYKQGPQAIAQAKRSYPLESVRAQIRSWPVILELKPLVIFALL